MRELGYAGVGLVLILFGCSGSGAASGAGSGTESESEAESESATTASDPEPAAEPESDPEPEPGSVEALLALDGSASRSVRGPNDGSIEGAVAFPLEGPGFRYNPRRSNDARWGTVEMLQQLVRAAAVVEDEMPGSVLFVNDIGLREGGAIPHHGSHRAGRDVDVLFYLVDEEGNPHEPVGAPIDPRGEGTDYKELADPDDDDPVRIDLPRTWRFVQALIEGDDGGSPLQRIFVVEHLRDMLLAHARAAEAPASTIERFAELTCQPSYPHDDHFHFRFFCSPEDLREGCEDALPHYAWRVRELDALGLTLNRHVPRPDRPRAPITTSEEARAAAGPMHPSVRRFLRRRRAWTRKPHPGRPHCP